MEKISIGPMVESLFTAATLAVRVFKGVDRLIL